jgi:PAS domain S-box-containing protein
MKILAVDDIQNNLTILKVLIKEAFPGAVILTALNGKKCLELAASEEPDVILLDIIMPEIDGFEVCRRLKADKKLSEIPIVFVTALKDDKESRVRALEAGGEAFLVKPFDASELTAQIRAMVKIRTANIEKRDQNERLAYQVELQTRELKKTHTATLNMLEDLKNENNSRKASEEALRKSEYRFRGLFESLPFGHAIHEIILDKEGIAVDYRFLGVNQAFEDMTGLKADEIVGRTAREVMPKLEQNWIDRYGRVAFSGLTERLVEWSDELKKWFDVVAYSPHTGQFAVTFQDITHKVVIEQEIEASRSRYITLLNSVTDYIYTVEFHDGRAIATKHGPGCLKITGYTSAEFANDSTLWMGMVPEADRGMILAQIDCIFHNRESIPIEHRIVRKDGAIRWVRNTAVPQYNEAGTIIRYDGLISDITERKQAEEALKESEKRFRMLVDSAPEAILVHSGGRILYLNQAMCRLMGSSRISELIGRNYFERIAPEFHDVVHERILMQHETGLAAPLMEMSYIRLDGSHVQVETTAVPVKFEGRDSNVVFIRDITDRKRVDEERQKTVEFLSLAGTSASIKDLIRKATDFFIDVSGCEAVGIRLKEDEDYPYYETRGFPKEFIELENKLCARDEVGKVIHDYTGSPVIDCMCGNIICGRFDPSKPFFTINGSFWSNCTTELLASTSEAERQARTRNRCNGEGYESVALIPLTIGDERLGLIQINDKRRDRFTTEKIVQWERMAHYLSVALSKISVQEHLRQSEEKFQRAFMATPLLFSITTVEDGRFIEVNDEFCTVSGFSRQELIGKTTVEVGGISSQDRQLVIETMIMDGRIRDMELKLRTKQGKELICLYNAEIVETGGERLVLSLISDISEKKELQQQLLQAQKMEAIGNMAGGIAHDFNNILQAMLGNIYLLRKNLGASSSLIDEVDEIEGLSNRASDLTKGLLAFSRKQVFDMRMIDLNGAIADLLKLVRRITGEDIIIELICSNEPLYVNADMGQLNQVLINLVGNARDAMTGGGTITLSTSLKNIDANFIASCGIPEAGDYAVFEVKDTGCGMDEETMSRIFEPFYTTKDVSKGTGLGLAIVYGVINQHKGFINVESSKGAGTAFAIYLPLIKEEVTGEITTASHVPALPRMIMVVEDEEKLRNILKTVLTELGHSVITAASGPEGIEIYRERKEEIEMVLMDIVMPEMNGLEVYDVLTVIKPDVRVLFMSGYPFDVLEQRKLVFEGMNIVSKPIQMHALNKKISEMLA